MSTTVDLATQDGCTNAELERLRQDAALWRELAHLLRGRGWMLITPARIVRDLPWIWPYGEFGEQQK